MKNIKTILIAILIGAGMWFFTSWQHRGEEMKRQKSNYENLLKETKTAFSEYKFKTEELEDYLKSNKNQLKGLGDKLDAVGIKLRKIEKISSTTIVIKDSTVNTVILDSINSLLSKLEQNKDGKIVYPIEDKTDCFEFKAKVIFHDGTISHQVLERTAKDTINYVTHWERKKHRWIFGIKTGFLGKKIHEITVFNNCGFSKTIVVK